MDDLVQFLRDRLNEDEAAAKAAKPSSWQTDGGAVYATHPTDEVVDYSESAEHIARHDPARVLAEVEAKRLALDHFEELQRLARGGVAIYRTAAGAVGVQVQIMALAYRDHPGYQEAWRPEHLD